ncbi:pentapeptide repeat-containing protein [Nocardia sp. NPDC004604]|uniref:pentapeptide repeat-containing protein n=1 Tax=Nocardia sp. NPDC004604 TaxID=3157013 RepID=UPI0033AAF425
MGSQSEIPPRRRRIYRVTSLGHPEVSRTRKAVRRAKKFLTWDGWLKLGAIAGAIGVLAGLFFSVQSLLANSKQYRIAERAEFTTTFGKAIEQIGSINLDTRLGGIYLLERLAQDSVRDRPTILHILSAYVREHTARLDVCNTEFSTAYPPTDVQAVLTVIGRRSGDDPVDLSSTCLTGANWTNAKLVNVNLDFAILPYSRFNNATFDRHGIRGANFYRSQFAYADLEGSTIEYSTLEKASLDGANLNGARFSDDVMSGCDLSRASLVRGRIIESDISNCNLLRTNLKDAELRNSNLKGTRFDWPKPPAPALNLSTAKFDNVQYDATTIWPSGFQPPPHQS